MPPKKAKGKKEEKKEEEPQTEYDNMDLEMLREVVPMLQQQLEKSMTDRNYVQLERDTIQQFYEITCRKVKEMELAVQAKDREMELMDDNHRVEVRVYQQKVKHLEFEHRNNIRDVAKEAAGLLEDEHEEKARETLKMKDTMRSERMDKELHNGQRVAEVSQAQDKQLMKMRQQFEEGLNELTQRCDARLRQLEADLELRRRVEIHENMS